MNPPSMPGPGGRTALPILLLLLILPQVALAQRCGDCNGDRHVNVVDALVAAQHDVGLITLVPPDFLTCNVDGTPGGPPAGAVTITDALAIAQWSVGVGMPLTCISVPGCTITDPLHTVPTGDLPIEWFAIDAQSALVDMTPEFSTDLGIHWHPAAEGPGGDGTVALTTSPFPGTRHTHVWDTVADGVGLSGPQYARFKMTVTSALGTSSCYSFGFCVDNSVARPTGTWQEIIPDPPLAPPPRFGHGMVYDSIRDRMIMYGGGTTILDSMDDVWAFDLVSNRWTQLFPAGATPESRMFFGTVFDNHANRMIVHGGTHADPTGLHWPADTLELDFSSGPDGVWNVLNVAHPGAEGYLFLPAAVLHSTAAVHEMVILGGRVDPVQHFTTPMFVAALDLTPGQEDWREIPAVAGAIPLLCEGNALIHDPTMDRLVSMGGYTYEQPTTGLLEFSFVPGGGAWRDLEACGFPGAYRVYSPLAHDPLRNRGVQFSGDGGGVTAPVGHGPVPGTLVLDLDLPDCRVREMNTSGGPPAERLMHVFVHDPPRDRAILFGGLRLTPVGAQPLDDTWELRF